ncbi:MAG: TlpA family protein disulfide reductase [Bacteroidetes bacterium]|nr:TlpA family protein disulfide reductase [Bacteroidota bacterium]
MRDMLTPRTPEPEAVTDGYTVKGRLVNMPNRLVVLQELRKEGWSFIDSIRTDKAGSFALTGNTKEDIFCILQWDSSSYIMLSVNNNTRMELDISGVNPYISYSMSGTEIQQSVELKEFAELSAGFDYKLMAIQNQAANLKGTEEDYALAAVLQNQFYNILSERKTAFLEYMKKKPKSLVPYVVFTYYLMEDFTFPMLETAFKSVSAYNPQSKYTKELQVLYNAERVLAEGNPAPDIVQNDFNGKPIALSSLRGKVVLIDFWASWCGPCRRENPNVVRMYRRLKPKGFEIYGVSLDQDRNAWMNAVARDSLTWIHVSDLRQWQNAAARLYKVSGIPYTVLLDRKGNIVAKGLRGPELEARIEELLAKP